MSKDTDYTTFTHPALMILQEARQKLAAIAMNAELPTEERRDAAEAYDAVDLHICNSLNLAGDAGSSLTYVLQLDVD